MSLYLPNLILPPDDRQDLVLCIRHDGIVLDPWGNQIDTKAIELPPHGRLGDLDALERNLREMADYQHGDRQQGILGCCSTICSAATIIPADGGEQHG